MNIVLNGESKALDGEWNLQQLLDHLQIPAGRVACEINLKIIKRAFYPQTSIREGDVVEVIQAIGGG
ncbi:MAG TPA: sulfur carrier protein ThiS [Elusimicrobiota bacterium]|nr:sulfur carrier protein ThiS [Elusimicrobiota bacterium]